MRPNSLLIFDFDGTLADLHLNVPKIRERIRDLFKEVGIEGEFRPLYTGIENALVQAPQLRDRCWKLIDDFEVECAKAATACPGTLELLSRVSKIPKVIYSNNCTPAIQTGLRAAGIDPKQFSKIFARDQPRSLKPSGLPIVQAIETASARVDEAFVIGDHPLDMTSAVESRERLASLNNTCRVVPIGVASSLAASEKLEHAGAYFLANDMLEVAPFVLETPSHVSLSMVLLAYNEEGAILEAIHDGIRFGELYVSDFEIVVVDDGSTDETAKRIQSIQNSHVRIVTHPKNLGMGASMRDGYQAAAKDYMAHLPGDRQVRPQSLLSFLPRLYPDRVVLSTYVNAPSGRKRDWVSQLFRFIVRWVGGLTINFAGTYVFHRSLFQKVNLNRVYSSSFLLSFEILQRFKELGASFEYVVIRTFPRRTGTSSEFLPRRIWKVFFELLEVRIKRLRNG